MSRGPGSVQRKILNLIAAEPNGAWTIGKLCREVYGQRVTKVQRVAERVAVGRALRRMTLPSTWKVRSSGGKNWLCDPCNLQSMKIAYPWHPDHFKPGGIIYEMV